MIRSIAIAGSVVLAGLAVGGGCLHQAPTDAACLSLKPITFSASRDSPETVAQIRRHNARLLEMCPALRPR